jgi:hypothetical protein
VKAWSESGIRVMMVGCLTALQILPLGPLEMMARTAEAARIKDIASVLKEYGNKYTYKLKKKSYRISLSWKKPPVRFLATGQTRCCFRCAAARPYPSPG